MTGGGSSASITPRGADSPQCAAMSKVLAALTTIGLKAATGSVTQADLDAAFARDVIDAVPSDALGLLADMQAISDTLVGKPQEEASALLGDWTTPFERFTTATMAVCS